MSIYGNALKFKKKYPWTIAFRLKKHAKVVANIIDKDETVLYTFCGQRNDTHSMLFDSCVVAVTNKRIIVGEKRALFGYYLITVGTELFNDLTINTGLIWGRVEIDTVKENLFISNIDKRAMDEIENNVNGIMLKNKRRLRIKEEKELEKEIMKDEIKK